MGKARILFAAVLVGCATIGAGGAYAKGHGHGHGGGDGAPSARHQHGGHGGSATASQVTQGVVGAVTPTGWTLQLPHSLPITVVVTTTTTYIAGTVPVSQTVVQPGLWVRVSGSVDPTTKALDATNVTILLTTVQGTVTAVGPNTLTVLSRRGATVTVTTNAATRWPGAGRFGHQVDGNADNDDIGDTSAISGTTTISSTTTISGTTVISGTTTPLVAVNDLVLVEGIPGADGHSLTAISVMVRPAAPAASSSAGDGSGDGSDNGSGNGSGHGSGD
jgi:hypothetical protein